MGVTPKRLGRGSLYSSKFARNSRRSIEPTCSTYCRHFFGQPIFSMNLRGCPNGKSIPATQLSVLHKNASNSLNDGHSINSPAFRTVLSNSQFRQVNGFDLLGRLVKSIPTIFMLLESSLTISRQLYFRPRRRHLNCLIPAARIVTWGAGQIEAPKEAAE